MIISKKYKFIFVKGRKVAGTSLEMILSTKLGEGDVATPISPVDESSRLNMGGWCGNYSTDKQAEHAYLDLIKAQRFKEARATQVHSPETSIFYNHMPLLQIEERAQIIPASYTLLISERNPYFKIISLANMRLSFDNYDGTAMENQISDIQKSASRLIHTGEIAKVFNLGLYQHTGAYKKILLLRHENFEHDLMAMYLELGLGKPPKHLPHAKKGTALNNLTPDQFFSRAQLDKINEIFAPEFETYRYQMM